MEQAICYERPQKVLQKINDDGLYKVGVVGIAGRVGSRLVAALEHHPRIQVIAGIDTSHRNDELRGPVMEAVGLVRKRYEGVIPLKELFGDCDVIMDGRKRQLGYPEDLAEIQKPIVGQSAGNETRERDAASWLFLPVSSEVSNYMRVGDCNVTALSTLVGSMKEFIDHLGVSITMMTTVNPEPDWHQDLAIHSIQMLPIEQSQRLYRDVFGPAGVRLRLHSINQTGGLQCYVHDLTVRLKQGIKREEFENGLKQVPHTLTFKGNHTSTFDVLDRAQTFDMMGRPFPPIVVFNRTWMDRTDDDEGELVRLGVAVRNKYIATAANLDALNYLNKAPSARQAMKTTDLVMAWDKVMAQFHRI